jgi:hypothetical protein
LVIGAYAAQTLDEWRNHLPTRSQHEAYRVHDQRSVQHAAARERLDGFDVLRYDRQCRIVGRIVELRAHGFIVGIATAGSVN